MSHFGSSRGRGRGGHISSRGQNGKRRREVLVGTQAEAEQQVSGRLREILLGTEKDPNSGWVPVRMERLRAKLIQALEGQGPVPRRVYGWIPRDDTKTPSVYRALGQINSRFKERSRTGFLGSLL